MALRSSLIFGGALLGALACALPGFSQTTGANQQLSVATAAARQQYGQSFRSHPDLYSGPEYVDYAKQYPKRTGHQYFLTPDRQPGSVYYNARYFTNLLLAYDVVRDQLLLSQPSSPLSLRLINEKVRYFSINDHHFIRLVADSSAGGVIRTGYYELLVDGNTQVLARRAKRLQEQTRETREVEFLPTDRLFIRKNRTYYLVNRKASALRLLADRQKEVQAYVQEHKLKFKKAQFESSMVQLATYYNTLPL